MRHSIADHVLIFGPSPEAAAENGHTLPLCRVIGKLHAIDPPHIERLGSADVSPGARLLATRQRTEGVAGFVVTASPSVVLAA